MINKIAFIIPTKDRPDDIRKLFVSMREQTIRTNQVIVIDASALFDKGLALEFPELKIVHRRASALGTVKQKNEGILYLDADITLVGYLDDDIILDNNAIEMVLKYYESAPDNVGGVSFNIKNYTSARVNLFTRLFLINRRSEGKLLSSGYNETFYPVEKDKTVEWLSAGATVWRRGVVDRYSFDEHFCGYGLYEEVDYSCRVGEKYELFVLKDAKVFHNIKPIAAKGNVNLSMMDVFNRYYMVKKYPKKFSIVSYYWSTVGAFLGFLVLGVIKMDTPRLSRAWGYLAALGMIVTGKHKVEAKVR